MRELESRVKELEEREDRDLTSCIGFVGPDDEPDADIDETLETKL